MENGEKWWRAAQHARPLQQIIIPGNVLIDVLLILQTGRTVTVRGLPEDMRFLAASGNVTCGFLELLVTDSTRVTRDLEEPPALVLELYQFPDVGIVLQPRPRHHDAIYRPSTIPIEKVLDGKPRWKS